jgi:GTPase
MAKHLPCVAIIGRPNVGKSTLFNRLIGKKLALVDDRPGVTRDRREGDAELVGLQFRLVDTAGFETDDEATLPGRMRLQTQAAVDAADVALFVIDSRQGLLPLDEEIARWLRGSSTPIILLANKAEGKAGEVGIAEAYQLGLGDPIAFSAEHGEGLVDLFEALRPHVDKELVEDAPPEWVGAEDAAARDEAYSEDGEEIVEEPAPRELKLAIVGRPNAGKSTLINCMIGEDRMITGPEAGITRDSISINWHWREREVQLIDTAGLRKKSKVEDKLERLSAADTKRAIDFAEVVVLLLDATRGLEAQDLRIADQIYAEGRALIIALNKWDTVVEADALYHGVRKALDDGFAQVRGVPLLTLSALSGRGIDTLLETAFNIRAAWSRRVTTAKLNQWFAQAIETNPPPAPSGKRIKLRYVTQNTTRPPSFVVFGTRTDMLPESYSRYLVNSLRKAHGFGTVPVRLTMRNARNPYDKK